MKRLTVSRILDGAGLLFVFVALCVYATHKSNQPVEGGMAGAIGVGGHEAFLFLLQWGSLVLGALFFVARPLLRLKWRYAWIAMIAAGVIQLMVFYNSVNTSVLDGARRMPPEMEILLELAGIGCILVGLILLIAQWLLRFVEGGNRPNA
jgi:hypothetical protein